MHLADFIGEGTVRGIKVKVIIKRLTKEESRRIFKNRPFNNFSESPWGGIFVKDEVLVLLGIGRPCCRCKAATHHKHLLYGVCPDCDGRAEAGGNDPYREVLASECCGGPCRDGKSPSSRPGSIKCCDGKGHHPK